MLWGILLSYFPNLIVPYMYLPNLEVLHGVLYPEVHSNQIQIQKKKKKTWRQ